MSRRFRDTYTSGEVAALLGIPPRTARNYLSTGKIPAEQNPFTKTWKITRQDLLSYMQRNDIDPRLLLTPIQVLTVGISAEHNTMLQQILAGQDGHFNLRQANCLCESLTLAGQTAPHLAIFSGEALCDNARQAFNLLRESIPQPLKPKLLVLVLQGTTPPEDAWGANDLLVHPFTEEELALKIQELLGPLTE